MTLSRRARGAAAALALLTTLLVGRVAWTYPELSATVDEGRHIAAGIEVYQSGAFSLYYWSPALPRYAHGLLPYLAGTRLAPGTVEGSAGTILDRDYWGTLTRGRIGTLFFVPVLLVYAYLWAARLYGRNAGLAAAALVSLSPNVIAHSALATVDLPSAATILATLFHFWRWSERPTAKAALSAALAFAAAILCKGPAVLQLGLTLVAFAATSAASPAGRSGLARDRRALVRQAALFALVSVLTVWALYRFDVGFLGTRAGAWDPVEGGASEPLPESLRSLPVPMPAYIDGILAVWRQAHRGWTNFLLGEINQTGWWYYFPVALGLKLTFPLLLLLPLAVASLVLCRRRAWRRRSLYPLAAAVILLGVAMTSRVNIGVRHVLPVELVLCVLASAPFAGARLRSPRLVGVHLLALALLGWSAAESASAHPDYLAYFNPIARGRELEFLADSNLDWGQDVTRLANYLKERRVKRVTASIVQARWDTLQKQGLLTITPLEDGEERPRGWVAVSARTLQGLRPVDVRWLRSYTPVTRIGKSIYVYYIPPRKRPRGPAAAADTIPTPP